MGLAPIIWLATMIVFLTTIFSKVKKLGGWDFWEIVFLTGTHEIIFLLVWTTYAQNLRRFINDVRWGRFDDLLLKPISPRFTASFRFLDLTTFGSFLNVVFVFIFSFSKVVEKIHLSRLMGFGFFLIISYWISYLVYFIFASLVLFFINSRAFIDLIFDTTDFDRYPAEIYPKSVRIFLTFFLPILFFAYIPTAFLLGKLGWIYLIFGVMILLVLSFLSRVIWRIGLRHYQSASS
jgi:ABC-2 type transport system permease protein